MIELDNHFIAEISQAAENAYPNECCGIMYGKISGSDKKLLGIEPCKNSSDDSEKFHRFVITPENMMKAEIYARKNKLDIVGFYHSHPDCQAVPSEYDRSHALPVYSYIIVSVINGKTADFRSWELDGGTEYHNFKSETISADKGE